MSSSPATTDRALRVIRPKALLSLGFVNLCCSANLKQNIPRIVSYLHNHINFQHYINVKGNSLVEVAPIKSHDHIAVS